MAVYTGESQPDFINSLHALVPLTEHASHEEIPSQIPYEGNAAKRSLEMPFR